MSGVAADAGDAINIFPCKYYSCAWVKLDAGSFLSGEYVLVDYPVLPIITIDVSCLLQRRKRLLLANVLVKLKIGLLASSGGRLRPGCLKPLNFGHYALAFSASRKTRGKIRGGWPFWCRATPVPESGRSPLLHPLKVAQYDFTLGAGPRM